MATPSWTTALADGAAVLLPTDPPRRSLIGFWRPDGGPPLPGGPPGDGTSGPSTARQQSLTVLLPDGSGTVDVREVPALLMPAQHALPVLTRAYAAGTGTTAAFWGAAAVHALEIASRGGLLPGVSPAGYDAWRLGPLTARDREVLARLAAAMPPLAHAVPLPGDGPPRMPAPESQLSAFLDAVADGLPRTPAAGHASGGAAFAGEAPCAPQGLRSWADEVAAGLDSGVRLSLRIEITGLPPDDAATEAATAGGGFRGVVQLHAPDDGTLVADAADVWSGASASAARFGPRVRTDTLLTLRRAAAAWDALTPLLSAAVPDAVDLADEDIGELLGPSVPRALAAAGLRVHWPRGVAHSLSSQALIGPEDDGRDSGSSARSGLPPALSSDTLLGFRWRFSVDGQEISRAELDQLAEAGRPLVRLRDRWVLLDPEELRRARGRQDGEISALGALRAALSGTAEDGGERFDAHATGWLETLRERLSDPERRDEPPLPPPAQLRATLRDYQLRGLDWLHRMTSLGLGACLADDMGLGKTVTLIALHLRRGEQARTAGQTLVVCPASLLGNWQREIERFAPHIPVRRFHGPARELEQLREGEFVLTTYGTMRLDTERLASVRWGMVVADEAQHVKNPFAATSRALRTLPTDARVALTGTPVENNLSELWSVLDWATPGLLGRLGTFRRRHADAAEEGDPAAAERLARLVRPFLLRRHKSDRGIAPELPKKTETDRAVALTPEQAGLYEAVVRESLDALRGTDGFARRGLVVKLLTALKQICNHPAHYLKEHDGRLSGRSGKLELLDELLRALRAEGAAALVFTQYVEMAHLLERHLLAQGVPVQCLHGGTPVARREEMVRRFQEGEAGVFLLSLKAAGTGLNLTRAGHVIHYDRWWNPAVEAQATDRAYRIGQTQPVQVHRLIAEGTVEDRIAQMLRRKQELADAVLGSGEAALSELSDAELSELVELRKAEG